MRLSKASYSWLDLDISPWSNVGLRAVLKDPTAVQILSWPHQGSNHRPCGSKSWTFTSMLQAALSTFRSVTTFIPISTTPANINHIHSNILLDRLLLWLRSAFTVALFRQPYSMAQHLSPSRVALIFGRDFVLMIEESNQDSSSSLDIHVSLMLHSFTTRAWWILALSSWNMPEQSGKKKSIDGITWSFSTFRNSADLLCLDLNNWSNPRL